METEVDRRLSARVLALLLAWSALVHAAGAGLARSIPHVDAVSSELLMLAFALAALVSLAAAIMEWRRARLAEVASVFAAAGGTALTLFAVSNGWFFYAPVLGVTTLGAFLALANRAMMRDELRHQPREHAH